MFCATGRSRSIEPRARGPYSSLSMSMMRRGYSRAGLSQTRTRSHRGQQPELSDRCCRAVLVLFLDHRRARALSAYHDVPLEPADLLEAVEVLGHRPVRAGLAREEVLRVCRLVRDLQDAR